MDVAKESRVVFLQQKSHFPPQDGEFPESRTKELEGRAAVVFLPSEKIIPSPYQTRIFDESSDLSELVQSIISHGVLQPVLVRRSPLQVTEFGTSANSQYELVAGERRLRAARLAGLTMVPAIVSDLSDRKAVEISIIENAQREDLNSIEEARAMAILTREFRLTQSDIAETIGKSRAAVANALRLLQLDPEVQELILSGQLSGGHGKALLAVEPPLLQRRIARTAARKGISVRALEDFVQRRKERAASTGKKSSAPLAEAREAKKLRELLDLEDISIRERGEGKKTLTLRFEDEKSWKQFLSRVRRGAR